MHATKWNNDNFLQPLLLFFSLFSHSKLHASMMPLRGWMFAWTKVRNDLLIPFFQTTAVRLHCFFLPWICGEKTWMKKENIRMSSVLKNNFNWQYSSCRYAALLICSFTMVYKQWSDGSRNWWKIRVKKILFIKECLRVNEKNSFSLRKYFCFVTKSQLNLQHRNIIFGDMALMSQPRIIILHRGMRHANEARRRLLGDCSVCENSEPVSRPTRHLAHLKIDHLTLPSLASGSINFSHCHCRRTTILSDEFIEENYCAADGNLNNANGNHWIFNEICITTESSHLNLFDSTDELRRNIVLSIASNSLYGWVGIQIQFSDI